MQYRLERSVFHRRARSSTESMRLRSGAGSVPQTSDDGSTVDALQSVVVQTTSPQHTQRLFMSFFP